jgi:hypothetical protein
MRSNVKNRDIQVQKHDDDDDNKVLLLLLLLSSLITFLDIPPSKFAVSVETV